MGDKKKEDSKPIYLGDSFEEAICRLVRVDKKEKKRKEKKTVIEEKRKKCVGKDYLFNDQIKSQKISNKK